MNTKLKSISFSISPKFEGDKDVFPSYSVYEFSFKEGISDLYYGKLYFYTTSALKASDLQKIIGRLINVNVEITDHLHAPDKDKTANQDYDFKRVINGVITSVKYLGKTMDVTTKTDNKPANIFEIDFGSPFEILNKTNYKYRDNTFGKLQDKLEKILSAPEKVIYGEDYKSNEYLSIKFESLDSSDKKNFKALPDNVCIQFGDYTPLMAVRKIMTDYGLNFNTVHTADKDKNVIKVFLSKGYGVSKSSGVQSSYFSDNNEDKLNYDLEIVCDQSDSGSPKLTSFSIDINTEELDNFDNYNDFLIHSTTSEKNAVTTQSNARSEALKNLGNKTAREKMLYKLTASHLIFIPGTVMKTKNYIDSEVRLIVDNVNMHILAGIDSGKFNSSKNTKPSIEETISAYELDQNKEPGSFADFIEIEDAPKVNNTASQLTVPVNVKILEAVVTDGDGRYSGNWSAPADDPSIKEPIAGSICICAGDNTEHPSMFYALPSGSTTPVQVKLTSTVANSEIFNIPRIGQKVLILSGNNNYYLHSFLAQKDTTATTETNRVKRDNALATVKGFAAHSHGARVHVWNATDKSKNTAIKGANVNEGKYSLSKIELEKNTDLKEYVKNQILGGTESQLVEAMILKDNTYKYYQDYSGDSTIKDAYLGSLNKSDCEALSEKNIKDRCSAIKKLYEKTEKEKKETESKVKEIQSNIDKKEYDKKVVEIAINTLDGDKKEKKQKELNDIKSDIESLEKDKKSAQDKLDEKNKNYNNAVAGLTAITNEFIGEIGYPDDFMDSVNDVFKIDHEGNLEINCPKGTVTINAKNVKISSSKSTSMTGSGNITMTSPGSIKMGCAGTSFSILSSAIQAKTIPFANGSLASFGSTLTLDAYEGTSLKAATVNLTGKFSTSMKDGLGAGFKSSKGIAGVSGSEASLTTNMFESALQSVIKFDMDLVSELSNTITVNANPEASKYEKGVIDGVLFPVANEVMGFCLGTTTFQRYAKNVKRYRKNETTVSRFLVDTCDFICDSLDYISKAINLVDEIWKMADEEGNWFEQKGHVGKSNAQDIKYFFASLKYTLNTIAMHAVLIANTWPLTIAGKPGKVAVKGGEVSISSTTETNAVISHIDARA